MDKRILLLTILCFFICAGRAGAALCAGIHYYSYYPNGLATATGIVEAMGLNSIKIYDEEQKRLAGFIYFERGEEFHRGDYVRVYYYPQGDMVQRIKRMTVLGFKQNGQNLGYINRGT